MANFLDRVLYFISVVLNRIDLYRYRGNIPRMVKKLRAKDKIKVLFVLSDLAVWKTEGLYKIMLEHARFEPIIGTTLLTADIASESIKKYKSLIEYLTEKKYQYIELYCGNIQEIAADITFYQQPYESFISEKVSYLVQSKAKSLLCDVHYSMRTLSIQKKNKWVIDQQLYRYCWQIYVENKLTAKLGNISLIKGKNIVVTGMPIQDELSISKDKLVDPWKNQSVSKKRIIYAPHHSLSVTNSFISISCFLEVGDLMLELAEKYQNKVQIAFKPHPFLRKKLIKLWGVERTENYYARWATMENTQLEEGEYLGLFKYSDAMIHDCDSFTIEYCYIKKPILFLVSPQMERIRRDDLNEFAQKALDLHDKGFTKVDIEAFILRVIEGEDSLINQREKFYNNYLLPPHGKSASLNIVNAILGVEEYKI